MDNLNWRGFGGFLEGLDKLLLLGSWGYIYLSQSGQKFTQKFRQKRTDRQC